MTPKFAEYLAKSEYVILDGALATELETRGCNLQSSLWSADVLIHQPELIYQVHLDYFLAGADVAITASYQASTAGLVQQGFTPSQADELVKKSVQLAKQAASEVQIQFHDRTYFVAGSVGPYGAFLADGAEYRGDYHLSENEMKDFHRPRIQALVEAGADLLACETMPSFEEIRTLLSLLQDFSIPCWLSFTLKDANHLSDGTPLAQVIALTELYHQVLAVGINCVPEDTVSTALASLSRLTNKPLIVYPNSGEVYDAESKTWSGLRAEGNHLSDHVKEWHSLGAKLIGGCCRTNPKAVRVIHDTLQQVYKR